MHHNEKRRNHTLAFYCYRRQTINGATLCRMFNNIVSKHEYPNYLSSDNDPLFEYQRWKANLRILDLEEVKSVPYTPISHPFVERLIGTVRKEFLDKTLFFNVSDLENKLDHFKRFYNQNRLHSVSDGKPPTEYLNTFAKLANFNRKKYCQGLFQLPTIA